MVLVNFEVTLNSLQSQLLSMIIGAEKKDLEEKYTEACRDAYEHTRSLREVENAILELLRQEASVLLDDDLLVKTLAESREVEQIIASKLRVIEQTSLAMQKSREVYSHAAQRASHMFFAVRSMQQVDHMFRYSLNEFMQTFTKALEKSLMTYGKHSITRLIQTGKLAGKRVSSSQEN